MDPSTVVCPNLVCPTRGQSGQGNIGIHSRKERRFLCTVCRKTFSVTKGTALYCLRTSAETVSLVITLLAHGCPPPGKGTGYPAPSPQTRTSAINASGSSVATSVR
jgi:hypothetical protein